MYFAKFHVDKNNHGPSTLIAIGNYEGGELWITNPGGDDVIVVTDRCNLLRWSLQCFPKGPLTVVGLPIQKLFLRLLAWPK